MTVNSSKNIFLLTERKNQILIYNQNFKNGFIGNPKLEHKIVFFIGNEISLP